MPVRLVFFFLLIISDKAGTTAVLIQEPDMLSFVANIQEKSLKKELYRKAIHISSLWIPLFIHMFSRKESLLVLGILFCINLSAEYFCYKKIAWIRYFYEKLLIKTLRGKEIRKNRFVPSGSVYVLAAAISCVFLFTKEIAAAALSVMLVSDACAAVFGKMFGSRKIHGSKTLEGTIMFFISALSVMMLYNPASALSFAGMAACCAATLCELYDDKIKIDDNFSVPLVVGTIMTYA